MEECMQVVVAVRRPNNETGIFWTKADPRGLNVFSEVNVWREGKGFRVKKELFPDTDRVGRERENLLSCESRDMQTFPSLFQVYSDMMGRKFAHPVMHKPPWNYVTLGTRTSAEISPLF